MDNKEDLREFNAVILYLALMATIAAAASLCIGVLALSKEAQPVGAIILVAFVGLTIVSGFVARAYRDHKGKWKFF